MTFSRGNVRAGKLTPETVMEIREEYNRGVTQGYLARKHHVSVITIGRIVRGETWQDYPGPGEHRGATERTVERCLHNAAEDRQIMEQIAASAGADTAAAASLRKLLEMGVEVTRGEAAAPPAEAGGAEDTKDTPTGEL